MTADALVLAGGGVAGIAWETGVLMGIADVDPSLLDEIVADSTSLIGTSAGATVAAQLAAGRPIADLFAAQVSDESAELKVELDLEKFGAMMADGASADESPEATRRRIGAIARRADTPSVSARRSRHRGTACRRRLAGARTADHGDRHRDGRAAGVRSHVGCRPGRRCRGQQCGARHLADRRDRRPPLHGRRHALGRERRPGERRRQAC